LPAAGVHLYGWALPAPEKLLRPRRRLITNRHSVTSGRVISRKSIE
jgi:hypothetical protein